MTHHRHGGTQTDWLIRPLWSVDGRPWTIADALRLAERSGTWQRIAADSARGEALTLDITWDDALTALVDDAAVEFRYARELEDASAMSAWLDTHGLDADAWWHGVSRLVLCARWDGLHHEVDADPTPRADTLRTHLIVDAAAQARLVEPLADRVAVHAAHPVESSPHRADDASGPTRSPVPWDALGVSAAWLEAADARLASLDASWSAWHPTIVTEHRLASALAAHRMEWMRVELTRTWWPDADAAKEAAWCVRDDARPLDEVAALAGAPAGRGRWPLQELPMALRDACLAAAPGDLIGPLAWVGGFQVAQVVAKQPADLADPDTRAAAVAAILQAAAQPLKERVLDQRSV